MPLRNVCPSSFQLRRKHTDAHSTEFRWLNTKFHPKKTINVASTDRNSFMFQARHSFHCNNFYKTNNYWLEFNFLYTACTKFYPIWTKKMCVIKAKHRCIQYLSLHPFSWNMSHSTTHCKKFCYTEFHENQPNALLLILGHECQNINCTYDRWMYITKNMLISKHA